MSPSLHKEEQVTGKIMEDKIACGPLFLLKTQEQRQRLRVLLLVPDHYNVVPKTVLREGKQDVEVREKNRNGR